MKNLKKIVFGLLAMLVMVTSVNAASEKQVRGILTDSEYCTDTDDKITCNVNEDITLMDAIVIDKEVTITIAEGKTLKLAGSSVDTTATVESVILVKDGGNLTIKGGTIDATAIDGYYWVVRVEDGAKFTLGTGTTINGTTVVSSSHSGTQAAVVTAFGAANVTLEENSVINGYNSGFAVSTVDSDTEANVVATIAGKIHSTNNSAVSVNGKVKNDASVITIAKSAELTSDGSAAIYAAGYAKWTIEGGKFTGKDGLSIKSGSFLIKDGEFTANGDKDLAPTKNGNGEELTGSAISISSHDGSAYAGNVELTIENGTFTSEKGHAVYSYERSGETSPFKNTESVVIEDGTFTAATRRVVHLNYNSNSGAKKQGQFINGGKFTTTDEEGLNSSVLKNYFSDDVESKEDGNGNIYVGEEVTNNFTTVKVVAVQNDPVGTASEKLTKELPDLAVGSKIRLSEALGINTLDYDAYKDYTVVITVKYGDTEEVYTTRNYNKSAVAPIFNIPIPGTEYSDMFVVPVEEVSITIKFVKTEELTEAEYKIEVVAPENGKLTVDKTLAKEGEVVNVTVKAADGYKVGKVLVNGVEIKANEDGTYSFVMPTSDVKVSAEFEKIQTQNPTGDGDQTGTTPEEQKPADQNTTENKPADEENKENPSTLDSIVSIVTLTISSLGTAGYSIKKFIRK